MMGRPDKVVRIAIGNGPETAFDFHCVDGMADGVMEVRRPLQNNADVAQEATYTRQFFEQSFNAAFMGCRLVLTEAQLKMFEEYLGPLPADSYVIAKPLMVKPSVRLPFTASEMQQSDRDRHEYIQSVLDEIDTKALARCPRKSKHVQHGPFRKGKGGKLRRW